MFFKDLVNAICSGLISPGFTANSGALFADLVVCRVMYRELLATHLISILSPIPSAKACLWQPACLPERSSALGEELPSR
mmetsp:Transcript_97284/g.313888  ORF Transcript_97284/g.313888 Transcript_97284/m.313888 type:complete len:80 (+) Transcript_97284:267-506(+)